MLRTFRAASSPPSRGNDIFVVSEQSADIRVDRRRAKQPTDPPMQRDSQRLATV